MITYVHNEEKQIDNVTYIWFIGDCLSTDFKPVDRVYDGSKLFEKDTLKQFVYNFDKKQWEESSSGSSGGSGILKLTEDENGYLDKTYQEIADAGFAVICVESIDPDPGPSPKVSPSGSPSDSSSSSDVRVYMLSGYGNYTDIDDVYYLVFYNMLYSSTLTYSTTEANLYPRNNNVDDNLIDPGDIEQGGSR